MVRFHQACLSSMAGPVGGGHATCGRGGTVGLRVGVAGQVEFVPLVVELATVDMIGMCPWALPLSHRVQLVRFQPACFLSVARPSISQGSAMACHLSVSGPVRSGNERVAEGTGWLPCWSCRLAPGWICSSLSNVSPPWTWISMCPFGSVPASVVGLVAVTSAVGFGVPGREQHHFAISGGDERHGSLLLLEPNHS